MPDTDKHFQKNQRAIEELTILHERHNSLIQQLLDELDVLPEQLTQFIQNKEAFSEDNWEFIISQKSSLDDKLHRDLSNIGNAIKTKKNRDSLKIPQQWLHVR